MIIVLVAILLLVVGISIFFFLAYQFTPATQQIEQPIAETEDQMRNRLYRESQPQEPVMLTEEEEARLEKESSTENSSSSIDVETRARLLEESKVR